MTRVIEGSSFRDMEGTSRASDRPEVSKEPLFDRRTFLRIGALGAALHGSFRSALEAGESQSGGIDIASVWLEHNGGAQHLRRLVRMTDANDWKTRQEATLAIAAFARETSAQMHPLPECARAIIRPLRPKQSLEQYHRLTHASERIEYDAHRKRAPTRLPYVEGATAADELRTLEDIGHVRFLKPTTESVAEAIRSLPAHPEARTFAHVLRRVCEATGTFARFSRNEHRGIEFVPAAKNRRLLIDESGMFLADVRDAHERPNISLLCDPQMDIIQIEGCRSFGVGPSSVRIDPAHMARAAKPDERHATAVTEHHEELPKEFLPHRSPPKPFVAVRLGLARNPVERTIPLPAKSGYDDIPFDREGERRLSIHKEQGDGGIVIGTSHRTDDTDEFFWREAATLSQEYVFLDAAGAPLATAPGSTRLQRSNPVCAITSLTPPPQAAFVRVWGYASEDDADRREARYFYCEMCEWYEDLDGDKPWGTLVRFEID